MSANIENDLTAYLLADAALAAAVGTRIFPLHRPQSNDTLPAIVYEVTASENALAQRPIEASGTAWSSFRFECWATTADGARALARLLRNAMLALEGQTIGGTARVLARPGDSQDFWAAPVDGGQSGTFARYSEFVVCHAEEPAA